VPVQALPDGRMDLESIDPADAERALLLWVNSPGNPTGALDDLDAAGRWGRAHEVPVFSDECYVEFTWSGRARTILESGLDGVVAVHSLSKRSNLAGVRVGFYAGDAGLVTYLQEIRKHVGPGSGPGSSDRGARRRRACRGAAHPLPIATRPPRVGAVGLVGRERADS
jgi:aspartate/methionine/tyrosine aminotransferase